MKFFNSGDRVVLNERTKPMHEHKGWLVPGRRAEIVEVDSENRRRGNRWYSVKLLGKSGNVIGHSKVPSNWMRLEE